MNVIKIGDYDQKVGFVTKFRVGGYDQVGHSKLEIWSYGQVEHCFTYLFIYFTQASTTMAKLEVMTKLDVVTND